MRTTGWRGRHPGHPSRTTGHGVVERRRTRVPHHRRRVRVLRWLGRGRRRSSRGSGCSQLLKVILHALDEQLVDGLQGRIVLRIK